MKLPWVWIAVAAWPRTKGAVVELVCNECGMVDGSVDGTILRAVVVSLNTARTTEFLHNGQLRFTFKSPQQLVRMAASWHATSLYDFNVHISAPNELLLIPMTVYWVV